MKEEREAINNVTPKEESKMIKYGRTVMGVIFIAGLLLLVYKMAANKLGW